MKLTRRKTLGLIASTALVQPANKAFARAAKTYELKPRAVADGIWMIEGATEYFSEENGGAIVNCAMISTNDGLVIVDTGPCRRYGEELRKVATEISGQGIAASINTHHHPDHFFGNQVFKDKPIHALGKTKSLAEIEGDGFSDNMYRLLGDWMRGTEVIPPNTNIDSSLLTIGGRELEVLPLSGHTDSDLAVIDRKTGVMIAGDLAFLDRAPTTPHADLDAWLQSLKYMSDLKPSGVLPGHGPFDPELKSLKQTTEYLTWLKKTLIQSASNGLDMIEIMDKKLPDEFAQMGAMPTEFHRSISHLYSDIERSVMPVVREGGE